MHKPPEFHAAFHPAKRNRFSKLYSTLREWNEARTARREQADALSELDAHILDDIGISKSMLLNCETTSRSSNPCKRVIEALFHQRSHRHSSK
jgi:uncharacterized protein YjiS (DUF1127 family)